jgi:uncharacterized protein YbaP (TraB family)
VKRSLVLALTFALSLASCGPRTTLRATSAGSVTTPRASATSSTSADADPAPLPRAWLWRVSGGDSGAPSYVLGTMHVGVRMPDALPPPYDDYLHDTRALVMEVDFRDVHRYLTEAAQAERPRPHPLDRALGPESWSRLVTELGGVIPPEALRELPPGALTLYLMQVRIAEVEAIEEGREPIPGAPTSARLDETIADWAIRAGRPIVALETPEQALAVLDDVLPEEEVLVELRHLVDDADAARAEASTLRAAYLAFDAEALEAGLAMEWTTEQRDRILVDRNRAWESALLPQIQEGNAFVAVGVGHLLGEGSVLEALRARGYTVERLGG